MNDQYQSDLSRRRFLQGAAAVGAGAMSHGVAEAAAGGAKLGTKTLGKTKLKVTQVTYGSLHTSGGQGAKVLELIVKSGVNMVHNSSSYRGGNAMRAMGQVFKTNKGMRDKLTLCLKGKDRDLEGELDKMLKDLYTDRCDVYLPTLHDPDPGRLDELMKVQDDLKKKGKIRFTGFVCHGALNEVFEMVLAKAPKYFDAALLTTEPMVSAAKGEKGDAERYMKNITALKKNGLGVISMKSHAREAMAKGADTFQVHCKTLLKQGSDTVLFTFDSIQQVGKLKEIDLTSLAMTPHEKALAHRFYAECGHVCQMCGRCTAACPQGLPVNDLMRIHMYHDEHHDCEYARDTFRDLGRGIAAKAAQCGDCTICHEACPHGLAGAKRVQYVASLFHA